MESDEMAIGANSQNGFASNPNMRIVTDYNVALQVLKSEFFEIPNLYNYLERLEEASGMSFEMSRCFVNASPFFLENERHKLLRQVAVGFLSHSKLKRWDTFFSEKINDIINNLPGYSDFDLVADVGMPIFDKIARPLLGVYPRNRKEFDRIATVLQRMVEPMLPLKQRLQSEADFRYLINMLEEATVQADPECDNRVKGLPAASLFEHVQAEKPFDQLTCYAFVTAMYAALAPLVQTGVNMLALIYTENSGRAISTAEFDAQFDRLLHLATAPKYIHRIALKSTSIGGNHFTEGTTVLIDIQRAVVTSSENNQISKHMDFGFGTHFCVGAMLSKRILKELVPLFMQRFPALKAQQKVVDTELNVAYAYKLYSVSPVAVSY